jgi:NitT/TauT family transport system substrate-binding protein
MNTQRPRLTAAASAAFLTLALAGCGAEEPQAAAAEGEPAKVTVGVLSVGTVAPAYLGVDKGFFEEEGLDVEFRAVQGGAEAVPMLLADEIQFSFGNAVSLAYAQLQGIDMQFVTEGGQAGTTLEDGTTAIVVDAASDIASAEDLAGKTFGVNQLKGLGEIVIRTALDQRGVDTSGIEFVEVDFPEMNAALDTGAIDAAFSTEPFTSQALGSGDRALMDAVSETAPNLSLSAYFSSTEYIEANPDVVERFQRAMNRSLDYAADHEDEARAMIPEFTQVPPEVAQRMKLPQWTSELNEDSIRVLIGKGEEYDMFDGEVDVDAMLKSVT